MNINGIEIKEWRIEDMPEVEVRDSDLGEWRKAKLFSVVPSITYPYRVVEANGTMGSGMYMREIPKPKMRTMTAKEIYALHKQGAMFRHPTARSGKEPLTLTAILVDMVELGGYFRMISECDYTLDLDTWHKCEVEE